MRSNGTNRVLIPGDGQDSLAIASAMKLGLELARKVADEIDGVTLFLPKLKSLLNSSLEKVLSPRIAQLLFEGEEIPLGDGLELRAEAALIYVDEGFRDIAIVVGGDAAIMAKIDTMKDLHTVIAVPVRRGALDKWAETWSPLVPEAQKAAVEMKIIDPVIAAALTELAGSIDLQKPFLAQKDKQQIELTIRILRRNKHGQEVADIRAWVLRNGWQPQAAEELVKIWEKVYSLKSTPKVKDAVQVKKAYEEWVHKAAA